jgi:hypothetical protein
LFGAVHFPELFGIRRVDPLRAGNFPAHAGVRDMRNDGDEVQLDEDEARAGSTPHIVRYVLFFSLLMAIIGLSAIWITGAVTR